MHDTTLGLSGGGIIHPHLVVYDNQSHRPTNVCDYPIVSQDPGASVVETMVSGHHVPSTVMMQPGMVPVHGVMNTSNCSRQSQLDHPSFCNPPAAGNNPLVAAAMFPAMSAVGEEIDMR